MKDWKKIASGSHPAIPADQLEKIVPVLEQLEASFRPMIRTIRHEVEPAITLSEKAVQPK